MSLPIPCTVLQADSDAAQTNIMKTNLVILIPLKQLKNIGKTPGNRCRGGQRKRSIISRLADAVSRAQAA